MWIFSPATTQKGTSGEVRAAPQADSCAAQQHRYSITELSRYTCDPIRDEMAIVVVDREQNMRIIA
jgi:hypothetical protein